MTKVLDNFHSPFVVMATTMEIILYLCHIIVSEWVLLAAVLWRNRLKAQGFSSFFAIFGEISKWSMPEL